MKGKIFSFSVFSKGGELGFPIFRNPKMTGQRKEQVGRPSLSWLEKEKLVENLAERSL
jgi:hypothetical protein